MKLAAWLRRWQELVFWLPLVLAIIVAAFYLIPAADPRAGIDGLAPLWSSLLTLFNALLAAFVAWWCQTLYFRELRDDDEEALGDIAVGNLRTRARAEGDEHAQAALAGLNDFDERWRGRNALLLLLLDRLTWFGVWLPIFRALQGLSS